LKKLKEIAKKRKYSVPELPEVTKDFIIKNNILRKVVVPERLYTDHEKALVIINSEPEIDMEIYEYMRKTPKGSQRLKCVKILKSNDTIVSSPKSCEF
jgi:hypothetical protein